MKIARAAVYFLFFMFISFAWSADSDLFFEISNETGFTIAYLQIADTGSEDWGRDWLEGTPLLDGENISIPLSLLDKSIVDVRGRDDEGDTYTVHAVDAGRDDIAIRLSDIDPD